MKKTLPIKNSLLFFSTFLFILTSCQVGRALDHNLEDYDPLRPYMMGVGLNQKQQHQSKFEVYLGHTKNSEEYIKSGFSPVFLPSCYFVF